MALFDPPFGTDGDNRLPTSDEQHDGFTCGSADRLLFTGLYRRIEAELRAIQDEGGIPGSATDDTTVLQAIQAMISAATGGGDTSQFVLFAQAQARLPIFPEVQTADGRMNVTVPGTGQVRVPAGTTLLHRGIRTYASAQTDFATTASKIYHLRWSPTSGFMLKDLSEVGYNPSALAENNVAFDSTYDDALIARVVTNSSNVVTVVNLANANRLHFNGVIVGTNFSVVSNELIKSDYIQDLSWSRKPNQRALNLARRDYTVTANQADDDRIIYDYQTTNVRPDFFSDRYGMRFSLGWDNTTACAFDASLGA